MPPAARVYRKGWVLTKYEIIKTVGMRATMLKCSSQALVAVDPNVPWDPCEVAERELFARLLPFDIERCMPDGRMEYMHLCDMA